MRWGIVVSFAAGTAAASVVSLAVVFLSADDATVVRDSSTTVGVEPAQFEVLAKGVGAEGDRAFYYVRYSLYGRAEELREASSFRTECFDTVVIGQPLPDACR